MTNLGGVYFRLSIRLSPEDMFAVESLLKERLSGAAQNLFGGDALLDVELEEGSVKGRLKVTGKWLAEMGRAVATYGALYQGAELLYNHVQVVAELTREELDRLGVPSDRVDRFEERHGTPGEIQKVIEELDSLRAGRDDLSPKQQDAVLERIRKRLLRIKADLPDEPERTQVLRALGTHPAMKLVEGPEWRPATATRAIRERPRPPRPAPRDLEDHVGLARPLGRDSERLLEPVRMRPTEPLFRLVGSEAGPRLAPVR